MTDEEKNLAARNGVVSVGAMLVISSWWLISLPAVVAGLGWWLALWAFRAGYKGVLGASGAVLAAVAGLHWMEGWPVLWGPRTAFSHIEMWWGDPATAFSLWYWPFSWPDRIPAWHMAIGLAYGAVVAVAWVIWRGAVARTPEGREKARERQEKDEKRPYEPGRLDIAKQERAAKARAATVLGLDRGKVVELSDEAANTHVLVVGTTGGGKTVTVLNFVESFIERGLPVLYVDGKGDRKVGEAIIGFARTKGRPNHFFSMTGESEAYNPLASGSYTSKKDRLIELREWSEPHYRKLAEGYLQMVFKVLSAIGAEVGLIELADTLKRSQLIGAVREAVQNEQLSEEQAKALMAEIDEQEAAEKHVEGIAAEIRNLARSEVGHLFSGAGLKLGPALDAGAAVYMGLSPLQYPALASLLGKLIVNDLKATLDPSNRRPVLVVFEEFGVFAGDQVLNVINQGRSAGVCAVLTVQSVADIGRTIATNPDHFIEQVFSNCNNYLIHRVNSAKNAEQLAAIIGTRESHQMTTQIGSTGYTGAGSIRRTREYHVHPDKIKELRTGEAVFLSRNDGSVRRIKARKGVLVK